MATVILDALDNKSEVSSALNNIFDEKNVDHLVFKLQNLEIKPCRSCGACGFKSPGKCVINDDMHEILGAIAKNHTIIMLTPIRFGGYSSCLKKAVDKFMSLCMPTYTVQGGHLLHPARYGHKTLIGIGVSKGTSTAEEESFKRLVEHNALNAQFTPKTLIINSSSNMEILTKEMGNMLKEVG